MYPRAEQGDCGRCVGSCVQINLSVDFDYPMGQVFGVMASPVVRIYQAQQLIPEIRTRLQIRSPLPAALKEAVLIAGQQVAGNRAEHNRKHMAGEITSPLTTTEATCKPEERRGARTSSAAIAAAAAAARRVGNPGRRGRDGPAAGAGSCSEGRAEEEDAAAAGRTSSCSPMARSTATDIAELRAWVGGVLASS